MPEKEKTKKYRVILESIYRDLVYESKVINLTDKEGDDLVNDFLRGGVRFSLELKDGELLCLSARQMKFFAARLRKLEAVAT